MADTVKITIDPRNMDIVEGTERDVYVIWSLSSSDFTKHGGDVKEFTVQWQYATGDTTRKNAGIWFEGSKSTVDVSARASSETRNAWVATYTAPENAIMVRVRVTPESKEKTGQKGKSKTLYFTGKASAWAEFDQFDEPIVPLDPPDTPSFELASPDSLKLIAECIISDESITYIEFQILKDNKTVVHQGIARVRFTRAAISYTAEAGGKYKVRARASTTAGNVATQNTPSTLVDTVISQAKSAVMGTVGTGVMPSAFDFLPRNVVSEWSAFSENVETRPPRVKEPISLKIVSDTIVSGSVDAVRVSWTKSSGATGYEIAYTTDKDFFDHSPEQVQTMTVGDVSFADITGLETGITWWFRVRATNDAGNSLWSIAQSIKFGVKPTKPTIWTATANVAVASTIRLYWTHNSSDGSSQTSAEIEVTWERVPGTDVTETITISKSKNYYDLDTSDAPFTVGDGNSIKWRVRTKGIIDEFSDWSSTKKINIYDYPTINIALSFNQPPEGGSYGDVFPMSAYPLNITLTAYPSNRDVIYFTVSITALESYEDRDEMGNIRNVSAGEEIYHYTFKPDSGSTNVGTLHLYPSDIDFEDEQRYTLTAIAAMNNGLTAESNQMIYITFADSFLKIYECGADVSVDLSAFTAAITPYALDRYGNIKQSEYLDLSVYRREYNGKLTPIATNLSSLRLVTVIDPHPSLNYARYRIVAVSNHSGAVSYADIKPVEVLCNSIIIQWDEESIVYDADAFEEMGMTDAEYVGSMLELPYNIDITAEQKNDVELVRYIGREHPVAYYGTMRNETGHWKTEILKNDTSRLNLIRRLANYMGNVYVREPSGLGYWAQVDVSYNIDHVKAVIPVTFSISRVDGGGSA